MSTTPAEAARASGYLVMFAPPALLVASVTGDAPWIAFVGLIVVLPFLRAVVGDATGAPPEWSETIATFLGALPIGCAVVYAGAFGYAMWRLGRSAPTGGYLALLGLSLWAVCAFATCVAHELLHRRDALSQTAGRVLSGMIGYPLQEREHVVHHARGSDVASAESADIDESVWLFTARRALRVPRTAWDGDVAAAQQRGHRLSGGLPLAVAATIATAMGFGIAVGPRGLLLYVVVALAVGWTLQAMTYIQHWAMGDDVGAKQPPGGFSWEDRCQLQVWLTLGISYHQAHHARGGVPYYRQQPVEGSPRQPAGYVVLLFASMVPPLWRALMLPALKRWKAAPLSQPSPGRRMICFQRSQS